MLQYLIVCPLVFLAGFVDAIGGGGGLISLPAYIISGVPIHNAIATNKVSSAMGTTVSTIKYARHGFMDWKLSIFCVIGALAGSPLGAQLALHIPESMFKILMLVVLPITAFYVMKNKEIGTGTEQPLTFRKTVVIATFVAFFVGIYDGLYGPGTGTFLILLLTGAARLDLNRAAGTTKVINLTTNLGSLVVFLLSGKAFVLLGAVAGLFNMAGNYLGAKSFTEKGSKIVKPVIIAVLVLFFIKILTEL